MIHLMLEEERIQFINAQHIKPLEFVVSAGAHMRVVAKYNDVGSSGDFMETQIVIQEQASNIEFRLPVRVDYNREIDLAGTTKAGAQ